VKHLAEQMGAAPREANAKGVGFGVCLAFEVAESAPLAEWTLPRAMADTAAIPASIRRLARRSGFRPQRRPRARPRPWIAGAIGPTLGDLYACIGRSASEAAAFRHT